MSPIQSPPNVDPRESTLGLQLGVTTAIHVVALTITGLRVYTRIALVKAFGLDDGFMIGATLCAFISWTLYLYQSQHGLGRHKALLSKDDVFKFGASTFGQTIISLLGLGLLKISLAFSLLRLNRHKKFARVLWATIVFVAVYTIFAFLTLFLYCQPLEGFWDHSGHAKCYSLDLFKKFGLANTALSIFTDILLASLPIPIIWNLQLKMNIRVYLIIMLALGWGAVAIGIVKAIAQINYSPFADNTYNIPVPLWAFVQLNVGIAAACAPQLKKLLSPFLRLTTNSYKNQPYGFASNNRRNTAGQSIAGRYIRQGSRVDKGDDFELDEHPINSRDVYLGKGDLPGDDSQEFGTHAMATSQMDKRVRRSSSSDSSLGDLHRTQHGKGIMMTTEVHISSD
ncbi:hypothetical protein F5Y17DRAFT_458467 [Xylariaceae sp. FL0594]|nr:hypothetical protein F5Y17DRAFT_458467 [Xylariaceae sp. FL0594]